MVLTAHSLLALYARPRTSAALPCPPLSLSQLSGNGQLPGPSLFCDTGGGGGGEILEEAGTFSGQTLLLSYPYPRGGVPVKEAGTHSPPCPQYLPNVKPHAMHQVGKGSPLLAEDVYFTLNLFPHKISAWQSLLSWSFNYHCARIRTHDLWITGVM